MLRYLRLYAYFLRFSFSRAMEFRLDFFFRIVMDVVFYVVNIAFFGVIYNHTNLLGGWDFDQVLIFASGFFMIDAIHMTVFANNLWWLPLSINKGDLDYYIVRPVSSLFFVSLRDFAANSFCNLLIALGIVVWAIWRFPAPLGTERIALYFVLLLNGAALYAMIHICFLIPVFWLHNARGFGGLFFALEKYVQRPHQIFSGYVQRLLVTLLPFALVASFPATVLFDGFSVQVALHLSAVTLLTFGFMVWFWNRGLASYSSASS